jgi:hypothetical protein
MATAHPLPVDPVAEALARPFVKTMPAERRTQLEQDLRAMAARVADGVPYAVFHEALEHRMWAEEHDDEFDDVTPEERAELRRRVAAAEAHPEHGIPADKFFAARGIPWPPAPAG